MASDIQNTATILSYTYFSGDREKTGGPKYDSVVNGYVEPSITLQKVCSVDGYPGTSGADLNEVITLSYTVTNNSEAQINYTTATIQDPVLIDPSIAIVPNSETGGTCTNDIITVNLPGGLAPGESATYTIKIRVTAPDASIDLLQTNATATLGTITGRVNRAVDTCGLSYNHAELTIDKQSIPAGLVTAGQEITYNIVLGNTARVPGTVAVGQFTDPIPEFTTFLRIDDDANGTFAYEASPTPRIYNAVAFTLAFQQTITLTFTVVTVDQ